MAWTDSHTHLQYDGVGVAAIARARAAGVTRMVCIGTDAETSAEAVRVAADNGPGIWATVGLHPHDATSGLDAIAALLRREVDAVPRVVVAVGECGLDYHYDHSPRDVQRRVFGEQIALARELGVALVIHTRAAWDDTFSILQSEGVPANTIVHCFSGGALEAARALELGAMLSFSGIVSFRNASDVREAASMCPLDRLLVETDAPFLAPVPHRGRTNEPAYTPLVGAAVAAARRVDVGEIEAATWANAERVFGLSGSA